jgi:hypothetical protein
MKLITRTVNGCPLLNKNGESNVAFETLQFRGLGKFGVNNESSVYNDYTLMGSSFSLTNKVMLNSDGEKTETVFYMGDLVNNLDRIFICASNWTSQINGDKILLYFITPEDLFPFLNIETETTGL